MQPRSRVLRHPGRQPLCLAESSLLDIPLAPHSFFFGGKKKMATCRREWWSRPDVGWRGARRPAELAHAPSGCRWRSSTNAAKRRARWRNDRDTATVRQRRQKCLIVDDMVRPRRNLCKAATCWTEARRHRGGTRYTTHGVLSGPGVERITGSRPEISGHARQTTRGLGGGQGLPPTSRVPTAYDVRAGDRQHLERQQACVVFDTGHADPDLRKGSIPKGMWGR